MNRLHQITKQCIFLLVGTILFLLPQETISQSVLYEYGNVKSVRLELNKPIIEDAEDLGFFSIGNFINAEFPLSDQLSITGELPFAFANVDDEGETALGNINLGVNYYCKNGRWRTSLGIGLPTASDKNSNATTIGFLSDPTEHFAAFDPFVIPIRAYTNYYNRPEAGFSYQFRGGFDLLIANEDFVDTELLFGLNLLGGYAFDGGIVQGGLSTLINLSEENLDFGQRSIQSILLSGEFDAGMVKPGIVFRLPVDMDLTDLYDLSIGLSLAILLDEQ